MIELVIKLVAGIVFVLTALVIGVGLWRLIEIPIRRGRESTFDYIYVDDNGNARELNAAEHEFVATALFPSEGDQTIKSSYESLNSGGRLGGYLRRRELPRRISVAPAPQSSNVAYNS